MKRTRSGRAFIKTSAIARPAAAEKAQKGVRGTFGERGQTAIERIACRENAPEGRKKTEPDENGAKIRKAALVTESGFQRVIQICRSQGTLFGGQTLFDRYSSVRETLFFVRRARRRSSGEEDKQELRGDNPQEHRQRVDRGVGDGRTLVSEGSASVG